MPDRRSTLGPEWLYEAGIGEARAALVEDGAIVEAAIELEGGTRIGTVAAARRIATDRVTLDDGTEAQLAALPAGVPERARLTVRLIREAILEPGRAKLPRAVPTDEAPTSGPDLLARLVVTGHPVRQLRAHERDALEAAGWSELLNEAMTGEITFPQGALRLSPTPAMTLFDVDGAAPLAPLALAAARQVALAIRRHAISGSIGIDFPTLANKAERAAVAAAIDAALPPPFERTAVNGFGFLQIVRPRPRVSLPELLRADPVAAEARATLRRLEREPPGPTRAHRLPPAVLAYLHARPTWLAELARRTGAEPRLESD